jgi:TRAP-type mannitol/chloroaromatic compound transport system permease small subunit
MTYGIYAVATVWFVGFALLTLRGANFARLMLNNMKPSTNFWKDTRPKLWSRRYLSKLDSELFSPVGQRYQKTLISNGRITVAWFFFGAIVIVGLLSSALSPG